MVGNKRGAIELSITTIVIVVIGITLLTLGLLWINNIFDRLRGTTGGAFEQADTQIEEILGGSSGNVISLSPSQVTLEKGKTARVKLILSNIDPDQQERTLTAKQPGDTINARSSSTTNEVDCVFGDEGKTAESKGYPLSNGFEAKITVLIIDKGAALGTFLCNFEVLTSTAFTESYQTQETLQIEVIK